MPRGKTPVYQKEIQALEMEFRWELKTIKEEEGKRMLRSQLIAPRHVQNKGPLEGRRKNMRAATNEGRVSAQRNRAEREARSSGRRVGRRRSAR